MTSRTLWHYTPGLAGEIVGSKYGIKGILDSQVINPSTKDIGKGEKPVVWFSSNQDFEPTAAEIAFHTKRGTTIRATDTDDHSVLACGLYRFGLPEDQLKSYAKEWPLLKIPANRRKMLGRVAKRVSSNARAWWFSLEPVDLTNPAIRFEYRLDGKWNPASIAESWKIVSQCAETLFPLYERRLRLAEAI